MDGSSVVGGHPPPSNRGVNPYIGFCGEIREGEERSAPAVTFPEEYRGFGTILAMGMDTLQEAYKALPHPDVIEALDAAKAQAAEADSPVSIQIRGITVQVRPSGAKGGFKWAFGTDEYLIMMSNPNRDWCVSVRYDAGALWAMGPDALRAKVQGFLRTWCRLPETDFCRLTRADVALDIHAPDLDMSPAVLAGVVCPGAVKNRADLGAWWSGNTVETITVGRMPRLQVQLYDKGREITEASGKTWMLDIWRERKPDLEADETGMVRGVWRIEARFAKEWLKDRNIRTYEAFRAAFPSLWSEALTRYRLTTPTADSNRSRWPLHPMWALALENTPKTWVPVGRRPTQRREALQAGLSAQIAGTMRAAVVLTADDWDEALVDDLWQEARDLLFSDPKHRDKVDKTKERYRYVDEMRG